MPLRETPDQFPPLGLTRIYDSLTEAGYQDVDVYNIDSLRPSEKEIISYFIERQPDIIGISAVVSTSYKFVKWLTHTLKKYLPDVIFMIGGNMAVSAEVLLKKCPIDICVIDEGEKTVLELCEYWQKHGVSIAKDFLKNIAGIVFVDSGGIVRFTGYREPLAANLIRQPNYELLDQISHIEHYLINGIDRLDFRQDPRSKEDHRNGKKSAVVMLSKGCVSHCTFCHRWTKGYRLIDVDKVIAFIKYLLDRFDVGFVQFGDENFGSDRAYLAEFLEKIKPLDILWNVAGMRAKSVNGDILKRMRECGCVSVYFGIESGSQKMLNIMEKNTSVDDNIRALRAAKESNIFTIVQLVIGMPGENIKTVTETIDFLKRVYGDDDVAPMLSINYAQSLPGTPLYEYGRIKGFIGPNVDDEERYLLKVSDMEAADLKHFINMTEESIGDALIFRWRIRLEVLKHFFWKALTKKGSKWRKEDGLWNVLTMFPRIIVAAIRMRRSELYSRKEIIAIVFALFFNESFLKVLRVVELTKYSGGFIKAMKLFFGEKKIYECVDSQSLRKTNKYLLGISNIGLNDPTIELRMGR